MGQKIAQVSKNLKESIQNPKKRRAWQSGIGITIFAIFVLSSVVVNQSVQALNQAAGRYGYYSGGSYGYNTTTSSDQVPSIPASQSVAAGSGAVVVSWTAVSTTRTAGTSYDNHSSYRVVYGTSASAVLLAYASNNGSATLPSGTSVWTSTNDTGLATRTTANTTLTGLTNGTVYYFAVYACDKNINCSDAPSAAVTATPAATSSSTGTSGGGGSGAASGGGAGAGSGNGSNFPVANPGQGAGSPPAIPPGLPVALSHAADVANVANVIAAMGVRRDVAAETVSQVKVNASVAEFHATLSTTDVTALTNFVTYGISTATLNLGSGERLALVRDQLETLGRVSVTALEQLATGQKPTERNLAKEVAQAGLAKAAFKKLTGKSAPDFANPKEDLAWNTMLYRIRFTRDLNKERAGITKFKASFGRTPKSPLDWAGVRAYGYALK